MGWLKAHTRTFCKAISRIATAHCIFNATSSARYLLLILKHIKFVGAVTLFPSINSVIF